VNCLKKTSSQITEAQREEDDIMPLTPKYSTVYYDSFRLLFQCTFGLFHYGDRRLMGLKNPLQKLINFWRFTVTVHRATRI